MDYEAAMRASIDSEFAAAASQGAECVVFGIVLLQPGSCIEWFNRAHRDFASAVTSQSFGKTIGVVGLTADGRGYVNTHHAVNRSKYRPLLEAVVRELREAVPTKNTLSVRFPLSKLLPAPQGN